VNAQCIDHHVHLGAIGRREAILDFNGGRVTSDAGVPLLRFVDESLKLTERFVVAAMEDHRNPALIDHSLTNLLRQRVYGLAAGYEDLNDHDQLMGDPLWALAVGNPDVLGENRRRKIDVGKPLASRSTLNRLELTPENPAEERYKRIDLDPVEADKFLLEAAVELLHFLEPARDEIVIDFDASDILLHGDQEGRFFNSHYGDYVYLPLYVFCDGVPLCWRLQAADKDPSRPTVEILEWIVPRMREEFPEARIVVRGDSGFSREPIYAWCEENGVGYVIGISKNSRLVAEIASELGEAERLSSATGEPARVFKAFHYKTRDSWSRERRVVAKAEQILGKKNPRFVVTSLDLPPDEVYEGRYCPRGDAENWIKEQQLDLFGDRASSSEMRANQNRGYFTVLAHLLLVAVREFLLRGTDHERATTGTIRLHLFKLGARLRVTARRVWIHVSSYSPFQRLFERVHANLQAMPQVVM
jgi:Transposase DDE domain group 1